MCFQVIGMLVGAIDMVTRSATLNEASIRHVYAVILAQSNALVLLSENTESSTASQTCTDEQAW